MIRSSLRTPPNAIKVATPRKVRRWNGLARRVCKILLSSVITRDLEPLDFNEERAIVGPRSRVWMFLGIPKIHSHVAKISRRIPNKKSSSIQKCQKHSTRRKRTIPCSHFSKRNNFDVVLIRRCPQTTTSTDHLAHIHCDRLNVKSSWSVVDLLKRNFHCLLQ